MNRKLMLAGAIALAGMLSLPSAVSAAVDDPVLKDTGGHLVVMLVDDSADFANVTPQEVGLAFVVRDFAVLEKPAFDAIEAMPLHDPAPLDAIVPLFAAADVEVSCSNPPWVSGLMPADSTSFERLPSCTTDRRHDPGWRAS